MKQVNVAPVRLVLIFIAASMILAAASSMRGIDPLSPTSVLRCWLDLTLVAS